jgi:hypothetical protein
MALIITHTLAVNNVNFGGKGRFRPLENVDAKAVNKFGGGKFYPVAELIKSYTKCF